MQAVEGDFLAALAGKNRGRAPVWFMRQAGRYLPNYRKLRETHTLLDLFLTPELAATITAMPVEELGVDAAILFSDITIPALAMGLDLSFCEGPKLASYLLKDRPFSFHVEMEKLHPVFEAVRLTKQRINVPLIGFCGGPFTVASYLVDGGEEGIKEWVAKSPEKLKELLDAIATLSISYLKLQIDAGVDAVQIFDSWANILSKEEFRRFCLPYYEEMIKEMDVPVILFAKQLGQHLDDLLFLPCALSLDASCSLVEVRKKTNKTLQGNIDPDLLFAPIPILQEKGRKLVESMKGDPAFIAGLGAGVKPGTPLEAVKALVKALQGIEDAH